MTATACASYPFTKISILIFYVRLAPHPTYRKVCFATMVFIGLSAAAFTLTCVFSCRPVNRSLDCSPDLNIRCLKLRTFSYVYCTTGVVTDVILLLLPIPILLRLQLRPKIKYGLVAMFATGIM